jgi:hypothetical protein
VEPKNFLETNEWQNSSSMWDLHSKCEKGKRETKEEGKVSSPNKDQ